MANGSNSYNNNNLGIMSSALGSVQVSSHTMSVCEFACVRVCTDFTCNLLLCFIACLIFIMIIIVGIT